jgi:hypothetical protein
VSHAEPSSPPLFWSDVRKSSGRVALRAGPGLLELAGGPEEFAFPASELGTATGSMFYQGDDMCKSFSWLEKLQRLQDSGGK